MNVREERGGAMLQVLEQRKRLPLKSVEDGGAGSHTAARRGPMLEEVDIS